MSPDWTDKPEPVPYADLSDPQSLNLYGYVRNNPMSQTDPDGHCCWAALKSAVATYIHPAESGQVLAGVGKASSE